VNTSLYPRLALSGIKKNFRFYLPFLLACTGMMTVFYITAFLAQSDFVRAQRGGDMISVVLRLGWIILTVFSAVLLFYTNSFLIKRRKKEFGLYNILGMSKNDITKVLVFEDAFILVITLLAGISLGVLFSKLVEILLINMLGGKNTLTFYIDWKVIRDEATIYFALFGFILVKGNYQVSRMSAINLFNSKRAGEKPPRSNAAAAIIGAVLLIAGYVLANIVKNPVYAILAFFGAVVLVIVGTYLLFISGSVFFCKLLQKNKKYYYKTNHFISTSQMAFRMKRNGAGLASICILATMALFTISSTSGLYFGSESIVRRMFPRDLSFIVTTEDESLADAFEKSFYDNSREKGVEPSDFASYRYLNSGSFFMTLYKDKKLITPAQIDAMTVDEINNLGATTPQTYFYYIPISDYNRVMGENLTVNRGEALVLKLKSEPENATYDLIPIKGELKITESTAENGDVITSKYRETDYLKGVGTVDDFVVTDGSHTDELSNSDIYDNMNTVRYRYAFINDEDFEEQHKLYLEDSVKYIRTSEGRVTHSESELEAGETFEYYYEPQMHYYIGANLKCSDETMSKIEGLIDGVIYDYPTYRAEFDGKSHICESRYFSEGIWVRRAELIALYGGLFFLGVMFFIVFVLSAVMIMYYKQVTEGFEDREGFEILQKVGMTKSEIRSSVNSQVLTLFFAPLAAAGVHMAFAFPMITKILSIFGIADIAYLLIVTLICFAFYSAVYILVYILTSKSYYKIVS